MRKKLNWSLLRAPLATMEGKVPVSKFDLSHSIKTTFNVGTLIPFDVQEVQPGDTFHVNTAFVARTSTMLFPVMDDAYLDFTYFFVPNRLCWDHWVNMHGENDTSPWAQQVDYKVPQTTAPAGGWSKGSVADYMGLPTKVGGLSISSLPLRAYVKVWNDYYRDQNLQSPAAFYKDDATTAGSNGTDPITDAIKGGAPLPVNKLQDYFTTCLPQPQKGGAVKLPLGMTAPLKGAGIITTNDGDLLAGARPGVTFLRNTGDDVTDAGDNMRVQLVNNFQTATFGADASGISVYPSNLWLNMDDAVNASGIWADLSKATSATINDLRQAIAIQRLQEIDAIGGTRYTEVIQSHWGVSNPDSRLQRAEFLGGKRTPLTSYQVAQTSATSKTGDTSPQANLAAFGHTTDADASFVKSFTEHGYIIGLVCVRPKHTYQNGIDRHWSRQVRFDYNYPTLNNLGELAVKNKEIYAQGTAADDQVFGYQEAWADLRMRTDKVTGAFRSNYDKTLDSWGYWDKYSSLPILGDAWIRETLTNFDRTLAVTSQVEDQIIIDIHLGVEADRCLPLYAIPAGLGRSM